MSTFVLLHGGAHTAWTWTLLRPELERRGHRVLAPDLPFDDPALTVARCVEVVAREVDAAGVTQPVLVAHSLGGTVLPQAAAATSASAMIFLCAVVPREGTSVAERNAAEGFIRFPYDRARFDERQRLLLPADVALELFYPDCTEEVAAEAVRNLRPQASGPLTETLPPGGWPAIPGGYVICSDDRLVDPAWGRKEAVARSGREPVELPGSHSPMLSRPADLAEVLGPLAARLAGAPPRG
jgi:pimeloyl-ACP methyl ester carboxylesterase